MLVVLAIGKELVAVSLDRETARAAGLPVFRLDLALYIAVTTTIVMSLEAVGNILVLALLITPAATARMLTERLWAMTLLASLIGCVVVVLTGLFVVTWCLAPRHGLLAKLVRRPDGAVPVPAGR